MHQEARSSDTVVPAIEQTAVQERHLSRRALLRASVLGVLGGAATLAGGIEARRFSRGYVDTSYGRFYPWYEKHEKREIVQNTSMLPTGCTGFMPEFLMQNTGLSLRGYSSAATMPLEKLLTETGGGGGEVQWMLSADVIERLAAQEVPIILGDIDAMNAQISSNLRNIVTGLQIAVGIGGVTGTIGHSTWKAARAIYERYVQHAEQATSKIGRRDFMRLAGFAAVGMLNDNRQFAWLLEGLDTEDERIRRAYSRVYGVLSHLRPYDVNIFFRNLVVARKLLVYAQRQQADGVVTPEIVFNYHGGHSQIEDFLQLGPDFCLKLMLVFPKAYLSEVLRENGLLDVFATTRVIQFDPKLSVSQENIALDRPMRVLNLPLQEAAIADESYSDEEMRQCLEDWLSG